MYHELSCFPLVIWLLSSTFLAAVETSQWETVLCWMKIHACWYWWAKKNTEKNLQTYDVKQTQYWKINRGICLPPIYVKHKTSKVQNNHGTKTVLVVPKYFLYKYHYLWQEVLIELERIISDKQQLMLNLWTCQLHLFVWDRVKHLYWLR